MKCKFFFIESVYRVNYALCITHSGKLYTDGDSLSSFFGFAKPIAAYFLFFVSIRNIFETSSYRFMIPFNVLKKDFM